MKILMKKTRRNPPVVRARPTPWSRFLTHAMDCPDCRNSQRCPGGQRLHDAVRSAARAAAP